MFPVRRANRDITDLYPYPIATAYLKLYQTGDPTGRHERLKDLFEVTVKYLAAIVLAQYVRDRLADGATYGSPAVDAALLNLKRPSLGHWVGLLRDVLAHYGRIKQQSALVLPDLYDALFQKRSKADFPALVAAFNHLRAEYTPKEGGEVQATTVRDFLDKFVTYRNKQIGHGTAQTVQFYQQKLDLLTPALEETLLAMPYLSQWPLLYIQGVQVDDQGGDTLDLLAYSGTYAMPLAPWRAEDTEHRWLPKRLYFGQVTPEGLVKPVLPLYPLLVMATARGAPDPEPSVYYLNALDPLEYISYEGRKPYIPDKGSLDLGIWGKLDTLPPLAPTTEAAPAAPTGRGKSVVAPPPTGIVTFLVSDIEDSGRLWETYPDAMQKAQLRHDDLMQQSMTAHGGYIFKSVGGSLCVAFASPAAAVQAAIAAQTALLAEPWPPDLPLPGDGRPGLRVGMALHMGSVQERDGDYIGAAVNRVTRLLAAGHGAQVLLSLLTADETRAALPPEALLRDMGERRLKDLNRPERIFQLAMPGWPTDFPALKTLDARPNNLPAHLTVLVGRETELERCRERLRRPDVRLMTLTGPGGIGKTRLALQVATEMIEEFEDGAFLVPLTTSDPDLALADLAQTLGVRETPGQPVLASLREALRDKNMLVVVDNFEQVVAATPLIADLLVAAPRLKFAVTSEIVLRLRGENVMRLEPLSVPRGRRLPPSDELLTYSAVALFVQRAAESKADFALTEDNAAAVVEICRRLDGLPLAIELAAARIKVLNPQTMLSRMENTLKLLTGGARDLPSRQQTIRNAISWSYDLLEEREKRAFTRLGVFVGGFNLEAAETIINATGDLEQDILDEVASLVDKSLLRQDEEVNGETRFSLLRTVREFALEQLAARGESDEIRQNHAAYYRALAEEAEPKLTGPQQAQWLNRLEAEHGNLRAALDWLAESGDYEAAWAMGGALWRFWSVRGYFSEGRACLTRLLDSGPMDLAGEPASVRQARAKLVQSAGTLAAQQGDYPAAREWYEESLALRREVGDKRGTANLLNNLGVLARFEGDLATARARYEESLALLRALGDRAAVGQALNNLGLVLRYQGDLAGARQSLEESLRLRRQLKDKWGIANSLSSLGDLALDQGDYAAAETFLHESLGLNLELGDRRALAFDLEYLAGLAAVQERLEYAAHLAGAAEALREEIQSPLSPAEEAKVEARLRPARDALGPTAYGEALAVGRTISLDAAIGRAFGDSNQAAD